MDINIALSELRFSLEGEFYTDSVTRTLYATDASVYREMPLAVAIPKTKQDIILIIRFAHLHKVSVIARTAGTSLAGQVVGNGIVLDMSKYWNKIIELNIQEKWVKVEPGVNLDELNQYLAPFDLFFGPETSTSNRCRIGGMVGNNSCGSHSIIYGTTRDHLIEVEAILSDGTAVTFGNVSCEVFEQKKKLETLEGSLYRHIDTILSDAENAREIESSYPKRSIRRRNTGYALDELLHTEVFKHDFIKDADHAFNFCKLIAGSEGTLAILTSIKLNLVDAPPKTKVAMAIHLNTIEEACRATIIARQYGPGAIELLDDIVIKAAATNIEQQKNLFFIKGKPKAIIVVEWARETKDEIERLADALEEELRTFNYGYHFPRLYGAEISAIWSLRKAGLGLLANVPGDPKAVACIEDTAVDIEDQPEFILEFEKILEKYNKSSVFYAHIGDGEIHLRPILDLKKEEDRELFFQITDDVATLVKKYRGSLSGEHGDGRVRGFFVKKMLGDHNYKLLVDLKNTWDPDHIFNPGKIVDVPMMNEFLRYENNQETREIATYFDFSETEGILRMAEKCNGAGDCLKSHHIGGTMCPSYMATRNEKDSTRGRANILREMLTHSPKQNPFDHKEIKEVMDLCLSCKGCKNECNSNVDMATLKAEFLQHYYNANGVPFRTRMIGNFVKNSTIASVVPGLYNLIMTQDFTAALAKKLLGIHPKRHFPLLQEATLKDWWSIHKRRIQQQAKPEMGAVLLFCDEFTNFNDTHIGIAAIELLSRLGYKVDLPNHVESGRTFLSKGLVKEVIKLANKNVQMLQNKVSAETPMVGIEPSAILSFRDEYPKLVRPPLKQASVDISKHIYLIDEFLAKEIEKGKIKRSQFSQNQRKIKLHGHCHQKAITGVTATKKVLEFPINYSVELIPSGCCGMAGSFGYEKEHYDLSMQIGELVLFPAVRKADGYTIAAPGTSCRHQIKDGTGREAKHPVELLLEALEK